MEFRDLKKQYLSLKQSIDDNVFDVISHASFISGAKVTELEKELASYVGVKHCISCGNGTDAITIALRAYGIGEGDAVFVPDFTFFSSGESPAILGATPIFVDVFKDTYNIDPESLENAIIRVKRDGILKPKAVVAVDLFGQPFEYEKVRDICTSHELLLLEDAAQGFGGHVDLENGISKMACSLGDIATTSFFPAKPLGCYGDGGAIFTNEDSIAKKCRSIAVHGKDMEHPEDPNAKYNNICLGYNSRLDTIQAAILLPKFIAFRDYELESVNKVADHYIRRLSEIDDLMLPVVRDNYHSSWAQFTVQLPDRVERSYVQSKLKEAGIPSMVYYLKPMHRQTAFMGTKSAEAECIVTDYLCERVLCLPIHPYMEEKDVDYVSDVLMTILSN